MSSALQTDVVIIGAGPVGLFGVFECGMLRIRCHVVDTLREVGGQCSALYPEKPIYDIPGCPEIGAAQLVANLVRQAEPFAPVYHLGRTVERLEQQPGGRIRVLVSGGEAIDCAAVVIAGGGGSLVPNRPPLQGIEAYEGRHVMYSVSDVQSLAGRDVVIAGGGDSAVDWAGALLGIARRIMVVHRRPKFRAAPASVDRMMMAVDDGRIELVVPYQLSGLQGVDGRLQAVMVADEAGATRVLEADALLAFFGIASSLGAIGQWGLELHQQQIAVAPHSCETSIPGVYAVGDIAGYRGKLKLILTGFAEAAAAAHSIFARVHPGEVLHMEHSTNIGVPALA
jgi:thioredoxin reductase (NADPH)